MNNVSIGLPEDFFGDIVCVVSCFSLGLVKALDLIWLDPPFTPPFVFPWSTEIAEYMMKFKPNQTRTYDGEGFKRRAACLCFKNEKEDEVLLVSSSRHPDQWIVPGGGMEPEEEPCGAAVREVYEEDHVNRAMGSSPGMLQGSPNTVSGRAGVKGKLGRLLGVFEHNQDRKHRTYVYVLTVTETLEDWEDSVNIGRKRKWFNIDEAIRVLQSHKPVHAEYLRRLTATCNPTCSSTCCGPTNGNTWVFPMTDDNAPDYVNSTTGDR